MPRDTLLGLRCEPVNVARRVEHNRPLGIDIGALRIDVIASTQGHAATAFDVDGFALVAFFIKAVCPPGRAAADRSTGTQQRHPSTTTRCAGFAAAAIGDGVVRLIEVEVGLCAKRHAARSGCNPRAFQRDRAFARLDGNAAPCRQRADNSFRCVRFAPTAAARCVDVESGFCGGVDRAF